MLEVPDRGVAPFNPLALEIFQEYVTFGVTVEMVIGAVVSPLQIDCVAGEKVTTGAGFMVKVIVSGTPEQPFAVGVT